MKRIALAVVSGLWLAVALATPALAGSELPPPEVGGIALQPPGSEIVTPPGGTAFTGSSVTIWMVFAAVALVIGLAFVVAGRRRARALAQ